MNLLEACPKCGNDSAGIWNISGEKINCPKCKYKEGDMLLKFKSSSLADDIDYFYKKMYGMLQ